MISSEQLGERICSARRRRRWTQADLADRVGLARTTIVAIEKGARQPKNEELVKIAQELAVQLHDLLAEHKVQEQGAVRFRVAPRSGLAQNDIEAARDQLVSWAARYVELERLLGMSRVPSPLDALEIYRADRDAPGFEPTRAGQDAAHTVRMLLGLGEAPMPPLDDVFEARVGLRIFYLQLPPGVAALLVWGPEIGACIGIEQRHPKQRRRYSCSHEIGHYLRDREEGDVLPGAGIDRKDASELFADAFAQELLMPRSSLESSVSQIKRRNSNKFYPGDLLGLAGSYGVSFQAMTLRLEDLQLLPRGTYDSLKVRKFQPADVQAQLELANQEIPDRNSMLPQRYVNLTMLAHERDLLSEGELADYLGVSRVQARGWYQQHRRQRLEDGSELELDLSLDMLARATHKERS